MIEFLATSLVGIFFSVFILMILFLMGAFLSSLSQGVSESTDPIEANKSMFCFWLILVSMIFVALSLFYFIGDNVVDWIFG